MLGLPRWFRVRARWLRYVFGFGVLVIAVAIVYLIALGSSPTRYPGWPADPSWQAYVPAPVSVDVRPVAILDVTHGVIGAQTLINTSGPSSS
jgi:hypothetical protein